MDEAIKDQDRRINRLCNANELSKRFLEVPGVGPITATIVAADIGNGKGYASSQDYAARWLNFHNENCWRAAVRSQGLPNMENVAAVILETDGSMTVLSNQDGRELTSLKGVAHHGE